MTSKPSKPTPTKPSPAQPTKRHDTGTGTDRAHGNSQVMPRDPGTSSGPRPPTKK